MKKVRQFKTWQSIWKKDNCTYRLPNDGELIGIPSNKKFNGFTRHAKMVKIGNEKKLIPVNIQSKFAPTGIFYSSRDSYAFEAGCKLRLCNSYEIEEAAKKQHLPFSYKLIFHPDDKLRKCLELAMDDIVGKLRDLGVQKSFWPTREEAKEWINCRPYSNQEKMRLQKCVDEYFDCIKELKLNYSMFMKKETYPEVKAARMICNCSKDIKWLFGTMQHELQQKFFTLPCTVKHIPVADRLQYVTERMSGHKHYYATDHTSFESSQTKPLLDMTEWRLYREFLDPDAADFMINFYKQDHKFYSRYYRVTLPAMRSSGDPDTSFGNSVVNLATFGAYCYYVGESTNWMDRVLVEGDDGLFFMDHKHTDYQEVLGTMGLRVKLDYSEDWRDLEFLSMKFTVFGQRKMDIIRRASSLFVDINNKKLPDIFDMKVLSLFADFGIPWDETFTAKMIVDNDAYHREKYNITSFNDHDPYVVIVNTFEHRDWGLSRETIQRMKDCFVSKNYVEMMEALIFGSDLSVYAKWLEMQQMTLSLCL